MCEYECVCVSVCVCACIVFACKSEGHILTHSVTLYIPPLMVALVAWSVNATILRWFGHCFALYSFNSESHGHIHCNWTCVYILHMFEFNLVFIY